ncbi:MAG TPA: zf-HC2 domain-containing protein [Pyrinomonadaceae bacterium]
MNCEKCQELIHDLIDGTLSRSDELSLNTHLQQCLDCESVRQDLASIVGYCESHRGEYEAPQNPQALWLRIQNVVEVENRSRLNSQPSDRKSFFGGLLNRSWELSFPQLASLTAAIVLCVSLITVVGVRRFGNNGPATPSEPITVASDSSLNDRVWQRQQVINYWNQRVELNKSRWSPDVRATFDRNMQVIDQAVSQSLNELNRNPHDEISEQMLNESLNDKLALLKEFSDL